jgi:hypothetical protein
MPRKIWAKGDEVIGGVDVHNEKLCDVYSSPNIIRVFKSGRMI